MSSVSSPALLLGWPHPSSVKVKLHMSPAKTSSTEERWNCLGNAAEDCARALARKNDLSVVTDMVPEMLFAAFKSLLELHSATNVLLNQPKDLPAADGADPLQFFT